MRNIMMLKRNNNRSKTNSHAALCCCFLLLVAFPRVLLCFCRSYVIQSGTWRFRGHPIAYEKATAAQAVVAAAAAAVVNDDDDDAATTASASATETTKTPVLLLNGFGVGSFHQHRLIHQLLGCSGNGDGNDSRSDDQQDDDNDRRRTLYCLDYLGQGKSWPQDCKDGQAPCEDGLRYCGSTWVDQIVDFIENVILPSSPTGKVHIVGNSVGGHLAAFVAAKLNSSSSSSSSSRHDDSSSSSSIIVESLCLLNPTPFWGLNLPGWNGQLPAPVVPKMIGRFLFDQIRNLSNIERFLMAVYANRQAFDTQLMQQIRACTNGPGGHAAFASILWSPPISITIPNPSSSNEKEKEETMITVNNFYDCLNVLEQQQSSRVVDDTATASSATSSASSSSSSTPILLVFGQDDPWCKPALARRMLEQNSNARYIELSNVGHCPNHEAPIATARILETWWRQQNYQHQTTEQTQAQAEEEVTMRRRPPPLLPQQRVVIQESWGTTNLVERASRHEIPLSLVDRLTTALV